MLHVRPAGQVLPHTAHSSSLFLVHVRLVRIRLARRRWLARDIVTVTVRGPHRRAVGIGTLGFRWCPVGGVWVPFIWHGLVRWFYMVLLIPAERGEKRKCTVDV